MKYKVLLLRSQDIISDSRVLRWEHWFVRKNISYEIVGWDRKNTGIQRVNTQYYRAVAGFQQRVKGIKARVKWNIFLLKYLLRHKNNYKIIHACDFDTVLPALCMKVFGKIVVFDIFDWFSDEVKTGKIFIDKTINLLERFAVSFSDLVIICETGRLRQIGIIPKRYIVIPNIPNFSASIKFLNDDKKAPMESIRISYVGGLVKDRGIEELIQTAEFMPHIHIDIAGFGDEKIVNYVTHMAKVCQNIHFYGKVEYREALEIMNQADILYGMYYTSNSNHVFAAPNKFYESLFLKKPLLTNKGTMVGSMVTECHSGWAIDEGKAALIKFLKGLTRAQISSVRISDKMLNFIEEENINEHRKYETFIHEVCN